MNIGEQINNLRKQHGLSQDDFANLFNVSRQTISNWENGCLLYTSDAADD